MRVPPRIETKIGLLIFALIGLVYFLSGRGNIEISDTYFSVQTAKAIVANHSLSAEGCRPGYCYKSQKDGKLYSRYGLGLAFIFTPYVILGKSIALLMNIPEDAMINFLISFYNIFFGAGACAVMFYLTRFFGNSKRDSLLMAFFLGLGTFCWRYSSWDFSEAGQMFFLLSAVYCALQNNPKSLGLGGVSFACLLLLKTLYIVYLPVFILYILIKNRQNAKDALLRLGVFILISLAGFSLILLLNYIRFGKILEFGYGLEANKFYLSGIKEHGARLLYWLDKGVFIYNPIFIPGILGYYQFFRMFKKEALFFASLIALNFILTSSWYGWHGGWSWGPRYLVPLAPLWLLPCFVFLPKKGAIRIALATLVFISALVQGLSILQGNLEYLTVCNANGKEGLAKGMPAQIVGSMIMLKHKIAKNDNLYKLSEFGIESDTKVDTSDFKYSKGLDLWYLKAARYFNKPALKFLPILFLPLIIFCLSRLLRITKV